MLRIFISDELGLNTYVRLCSVLYIVMLLCTEPTQSLGVYYIVEQCEKLFNVDDGADDRIVLSICDCEYTAHATHLYVSYVLCTLHTCENTMPQSRSKIK